MKDNSRYVAIGLAIITVVIVIISLITKGDGQDSKQKSPLIVTNYSNFYTVNSCLYRVITYVSSKDKVSLMLLLNSDYKEKNKITNDNVMSLFSNVNAGSTFVSKKMYYENLSSNLIKYYVEGYVDENKIFDDESLVKTERDSVYFIVYLDSSSNIFSIEPYDGNIFKVGDINEE